MRGYGTIFTIFTFPGVVVHEIAHRFFCDLCGVPVYEVSYFRQGDPCGYVTHGEVNSVLSAILISLGPLIINSLLCMILTFPFVLPLSILHAPYSNPGLWVLGWLGLSIGIHAFPSPQDLSNLKHHIKTISKSVSVHFFANIILGSLHIISLIGNYDLFSLAYAVILSMILPNLI